MKSWAVFLSTLLVAVSANSQQKPAPAKLVKQEVVEGRKVCHYADGSSIIMKHTYEVCPPVWRLID